MNEYGKRRILRVSYPIFLGLLAQNIINVTDTAFLGHVGEIELGASAIGGLYYICFFTLAFGFSIGAQILMARRNGAGEFRGIGPVLMQGSLFSFCFALVLIAAGLLTARGMMSLMISSEHILEASLSFFSIRIWGVLFSFLNTMFRAFYVAITRTKVLTLNAIVMALINVFLDWALIFGNAGFPALGLEGAAAASVAAEAGSLLFFLIYTRMTVDIRKYGLEFSLRPDFRVIRTVLGISVFMMIQQFVPLATWFVFFLALEHLGERQLAIANVARSIYILALIPVQALSTTVNTLAGNAMGASDTAKVIPLTRRIALMSLCTAAVCAAVMLLFPKMLLNIYTSDQSLVTDTIPSLAVIAASLMVASLSNVCFNAISGTGNARSALAIEIGAQIIYTAYIIVTSWILRWSVAGCFTCELVYYTLLLAGSAAYLKHGGWKYRRI